MKKEHFEAAFSRLQELAGEAHGLLTAEETVNIALQYEEVTEQDIFALVEALGEGIRLVEPQRKAQILQALTPERNPSQDSLVELSLMDTMLTVLLRREMPAEVRQAWQAALEENPLHKQIFGRRLNTVPEVLAAELRISLPELYFLEREMYDLYYPIARGFRK